MTINIDPYKTQLVQMLAAITEELETLGIHNPDVSEDWIATPDQVTTEADQNIIADRAEDYGERRATLAILETRYNNIQRALKKTIAGTYGTCEVCGVKIESDRLDANPAARTCKAHINKESELES